MPDTATAGLTDAQTKERAIAESNWRAYERVLDAGHGTWLEESKKYNDMYIGEQWSAADKAKLENERRPALTINEIMRVANAYMGELAMQQAQIKFKPAREGTPQLANILTKVAQQIQNDNKYGKVEAQVFEDGLIQDRGFFDVRMDFSTNMLGDIRITAEDPSEIAIDPFAKEYDPATWNEVIKYNWYTMDELELVFGKGKLKELQTLSGTGDTFGSMSMRYEERNAFGDIDTYGMHSYDLGQFDDSYNRNPKIVKVIERQHRQLAKVPFFLDPTTGDMRQIPHELDPDRIQYIARQYDLQTLERIIKRVRWTVSADHILLHDEWSPYKEFTIVPYFPYFRRGKPSGLVRQLISPQEQLNKVESQELHVINTTANSGWTYEEGSLTNMTPEELEERGAETGLVIGYKPGSQPPDKIQGNNVPTGLDRMAEKARGNVLTISGIEGLIAAPTREVSGVAVTQRRQVALVQANKPFEHLKGTREVVGQRMLELIQQFYTETRVFRITGQFETLSEGTDPETEEIVINAVDDAGNVINNPALGTYDVVVSSGPARDNFMEAQMATALQLREAGVMIPDHVVIEASDLEDKHQIAQQVKQLQGLAEPTPQEAALAEVQMQLQMQAMGLELQKLEAEVAKLRSEAGLTQAKALNEGEKLGFEGAALGAKYKFELDKLMADVQKHSSELQNKYEIAQVHAGTKRETELARQASDRAVEELKMRAAALKQIAPPSSASGNSQISRGQ